MWPNFLYTTGAANVSWTHDCDKMRNAARRDSPIGPLCCAKGGCVPQEADMGTIAAWATKHVESVIPDDLTGIVVKKTGGQDHTTLRDNRGIPDSWPICSSNSAAERGVHAEIIDHASGQSRYTLAILKSMYKK